MLGVPARAAAGADGAASGAAAAAAGAAGDALAAAGNDDVLVCPMKNTTESPTTRTVRNPSAPQNQPGSSLRRAPSAA